MMEGFYVRILLFYSAQGDANRFQTSNMSARLKRSMSEVLTEFYPLAGRYSNIEMIECDDEGLEYLEAQVKAPFTLNQLLACPNAEELDLLFPYVEPTYGNGFKGLSAAQVTVFEKCGSMTIGVSISHKVVDASSLGMFVNSWAAIAKGDAKMPSPKFEFASMFPQRNVLLDQPRDVLEKQPPSNQHDATKQQPKLITKRFVFPQMKIDTLKTKFAYGCPTRVEAVSALLFKCLIKSNNSRSSKTILLSMSVNLRGRMSPPLPMHYFGNMSGIWVTEYSGPNSLSDLGMQIRKSVKKFDGDYLKKLQADNALLLFEKFEHEKQIYAKLFTQDDVRAIDISSWCKFSFYEVDVGWGTPTWVTSIFPYFQGIVLMDAKNGDGIEGWVTLEEQDMAYLESDDEFLHFVSLNMMVRGL